MPQWLLTLCTKKKQCDLVQIAKRPERRAAEQGLDHQAPAEFRTQCLRTFAAFAFMPSSLAWLWDQHQGGCGTGTAHLKEQAQGLCGRKMHQDSQVRTCGPLVPKKYGCLLQVPSSHLQVASCLIVLQDSIFKSFSEVWLIDVPWLHISAISHSKLTHLFIAGTCQGYELRHRFVCDHPDKQSLHGGNHCRI